MKPAVVAFRFAEFKKEVEPLEGDDLLDKWIDFEGTPESKEPDLGLLKKMFLESALAAKFGISWHKAVEARRKSKSNA